MRQVTLVFLLKRDSNEILLAMKKRGFGAGKYNGVGGKVDNDETVEAAAVREAEEEVSVKILESDLNKAGELKFHFQDKPEWDLHCFVFTAEAWSGEPAESDEMAPEWFSLDKIPFEKMWVDDRYWLPMVLRGDYVAGEFTFTNDGSEVLSYTINGSKN